MEISKHRRKVIKRACIVYQTALLDKKYKNLITAEDAKQELQTVACIINDFNLLDRHENTEMPTFDQFEELLNQSAKEYAEEEAEQLIEPVTWAEMEIQAIKKC